MCQDGDRFDALAVAERRELLAHRRIGEHALCMRLVVEQTGGVEDLEARLKTDEESGGRDDRLDGAHRGAFDRCRNRAELVGGIELDLDLAARARLDAGLELLRPFLAEIVHRRR